MHANSIQSYWKFFLFEGIALFILGLLALASPQMMTLSIELLIGCLLIAGGVIQFIRVYNAKTESGFFDYLSAIITFIAGVLILAHPLIGSLTLTLLLASYFLVQGLVHIFYAIRHWALLKWKGLLLNGIISLILGLLIWEGWPDNSLWVLGMYVGIYLLFLGLGLVVMGLQLRKVRRA